MEVILGISTHVLDTARGRPAAGVAVRLERLEGSSWEVLGSVTSDPDGRARFLSEAHAAPGTYRLRFEVAAHFAAGGEPGFFPFVEVAFNVTGGRAQHHVPLLLGPYGYTTYLGS